MTPPPVLRLVPGLGFDEAWRPTLEALPSVTLAGGAHMVPLTHGS